MAYHPGMQCNIDAHGKAVRLRVGLVAIAVGLAGIAIRLFCIQNADWLLFAGVAIFAAGAFGVFEARAGWCVVRAMGFKTRI